MDKKTSKGISEEKKAAKMAAKQAKAKKKRRILWGIVAVLLGVGLIGTSILWSLGSFSDSDLAKETEEVDTQQVVAEAEAALAADPDNTSLIKDLAEAYLQNNQFTEAVEQFIIVTESSPQDIDAWLSQAVAQCYSGDYEASKKSFETAIDVNKEYAASYYYYGYYLGYGMGDYQAGIEQLEKYIDVVGENGDTSSAQSLIDSMKAALEGNDDSDADSDAAGKTDADSQTDSKS